jgi:hypothetical protein
VQGFSKAGLKISELEVNQAVFFDCTHFNMDLHKIVYKAGIAVLKYDPVVFATFKQSLNDLLKYLGTKLNLCETAYQA